MNLILCKDIFKKVVFTQKCPFNLIVEHFHVRTIIYFYKMFGQNTENNNNNNKTYTSHNKNKHETMKNKNMRYDKIKLIKCIPFFND